MVNGVRIAALGLVGLAALFNVIGVATNYWAKQTVLGIDSNLGLWRGCVEDTCGDIKGSAVNSKLEAARGLTILPLLMVVGSGVLLGLSNRPQSFGASNSLPLIAMGLLIVQAIFVAGGVGAGWKYFSDISSQLDPGYSLALTAVACVMYFIAAVLAGLSTRMGMA